MKTAYAQQLTQNSPLYDVIHPGCPQRVKAQQRSVFIEYNSARLSLDARQTAASSHFRWREYRRQCGANVGDDDVSMTRQLETSSGAAENADRQADTCVEKPCKFVANSERPQNNAFVDKRVPARL